MPNFHCELKTLCDIPSKLLTYNTSHPIGEIHYDECTKFLQKKSCEKAGGPLPVFYTLVHRDFRELNRQLNGKDLDPIDTTLIKSKDIKLKGVSKDGLCQQSI